MKKIILMIVAILFISNINIVNVKANSFTTTMQAPSSIVTGSEFNVVVGVSGSPSVQTFLADFSYDSSKLQLIDSQTTGGAVATVGPRILVDYDPQSTGISRSGTFSVITL